MRKQRAFASLSESEINQVAEWVRAQKYDDVIARVAQPRPDGFDLKVSRKPLQLLFAKVSRLRKINAHLDAGTKLTLADLDQIEAGEKGDLCQEAHDAILIATHASPPRKKPAAPNSTKPGRTPTPGPASRKK